MHTSSLTQATTFVGFIDCIGVTGARVKLNSITTEGASYEIGGGEVDSHVYTILGGRTEFDADMRDTQIEIP